VALVIHNHLTKEGKVTIKRLILSMSTVVTFCVVSAGWIYGGMPDKPKSPQISRAELAFPGGGKAWYVTNEDTGCIEYFYFINEKKENQTIEPRNPAWIANERKMFDFGSFTNSQCREGVIAVSSCPIEYFGVAHGQIYCIGAWDWAHGKWYQPCQPSYPPCP
jgi:hypothetical protein